MLLSQSLGGIPCSRGVSHLHSQMGCQPGEGDTGELSGVLQGL